MDLSRLLGRSHTPRPLLTRERSAGRGSSQSPQPLRSSEQCSEGTSDPRRWLRSRRGLCFFLTPLPFLHGRRKGNARAGSSWEAESEGREGWWVLYVFW